MKKLTDEQYWTKFAKLTQIEKELVIQEAFGVTQEVAKTYYNLLLSMIKKKQFLFELVNRKQEQDVSNILKLIDEAKLKKIKQKRNTKETRLQRKFKFHIFEVDQLRQTGVGWIKIANYLKKEHHINISYKSVARLYERYKNLL